MLATMWNRIVGPCSVTCLIHDISVTMKWTRQHHVFFVEVYVRNGNSVVTAEQSFCTEFQHSSSLHSHMQCYKSTGTEFLGKSLSLQNKPQGKVSMVWTPKNAEVWEVRSVQQGGITLPYTTWSKYRDFWTKILIFILTKLRFFKNELTVTL